MEQSLEVQLFYRPHVSQDGLIHQCPDGMCMSLIFYSSSNHVQSEEKIRKARLIIEATIPSKPNIGEREAAARDLMRFLSETDEERTASVSNILFF